MIEVRSKTHIQRLFATELSWKDLFSLVMYVGYRGDKTKIPFFYKKVYGHSSEIDLTEDMDVILSNMKSNTRNEIRRAEREGCEVSFNCDIDEFIPYYNTFCKTKGLHDSINKARLAKYKNVLISKVCHSGQTITMHANLLDEDSKVALLLFSCSPRLVEGVDKKIIGWGNRYLHYKDLEYLKDCGYKLYDWSGVNTDPENPRYSIGQFKLSFGGNLIDTLVLTTPLFELATFIRNKIR